MIGKAPAPARPDLWDPAAIDPAVRVLAEEAADAAGLSLEAWLERAIRRACPAGVAPAAAAPETPADMARLIAMLAPEMPPPPSHREVVLYQRPSALRRWRGFIWSAAILAPVFVGAAAALYFAPVERAMPVREASVSLALPPASPGPPAPLPEPQAASESVATSPELLPAPIAWTGTAEATAMVEPPAEATPPPAEPAPTKPLAEAKPDTANEAATNTAILAPAPTDTMPELSQRPLAPAELSAEAPQPPPAAAAKPGKPPPAPRGDPPEFAAALEPLAAAGDARSQYALANSYAGGKGVPLDHARAVALYQAAAETGMAEAQFSLGVMYAAGRGVAKDAAQAGYWYRKAADQGHAGAAFNLGDAYIRGSGVVRNPSEAAHWFRRAAESGNADAQFNLGILYERGDGVPASPVEAYAWFTLADINGDPAAANARNRIARKLPPERIAEAEARATSLLQSLEGPR